MAQGLVGPPPPMAARHGTAQNMAAHGYSDPPPLFLPRLTLCTHPYTKDVCHLCMATSCSASCSAFRFASCWTGGSLLFGQEANCPDQRLPPV